MVADDNLELTALYNDAHNAVDCLYGSLIGFFLVLQDESQSGHAMSDTGNVINAANFVHDCF